MSSYLVFPGALFAPVMSVKQATREHQACTEIPAPELRSQRLALRLFHHRCSISGCAVVTAQELSLGATAVQSHVSSYDAVFRVVFGDQKMGAN